MRIGRWLRALIRPWKWPTFLIWHYRKPVPPGLCLVNWIFQRIFGVNGHIPFMVHYTSRVVGVPKIGRNVWISFAVSGGLYVQCNNGVEIGDDTIIAPGVKIISANHDLSGVDCWISGPPIRIGNLCWIAANAVILPGVTLGDGVVVGAGAVVTRSFPEGAVIAGVPAKMIRQRTGEQTHSERATAGDGERAV